MAKQNTTYDITEAFERIEEELMSSMIRNMDRHRAEEVKEGIQWTQWQTEQLKALEQYRLKNQKKFNKQFSKLNKNAEQLIKIAHDTGNMDQEEAILKAIKNGFKSSKKMSNGMQAEFFKINERKLNALIKATTDDMKKAERAVLRMANDQYRKIIFNAQVYANTGAGTYEQAVDMATKDFVSSGLNCVEYANGARHTLADYIDMALRTASKRAYLQGEGEKRQEWGISTVIMNKRGNPCPKCLPFVGKVLIDDVWSGGSKEDGEYMLMSTAMAAGLYHPRCRDSHTTYFEGISRPPDSKFTKKEIDDIEKGAKETAKKQHAERQEEKYERLDRYSLDKDNKKQYKNKAKQWNNVHFKTGNMNSKEYVDSKRPLANFRAIPQSQVVNILRKESEEWIEKLTSEEKRAIRKYTYNSGDKKPNRFFERLNAMLRGDLPKDEKLEKYADTISGAIKKNKLKHDVIVYRGVSIDPTKGVNVDELVEPGQFFSSSVIDARSFEENVKIVIYVKKGSSAAYIENLSHFKSQRELLLDKDCIYRVLSRKENVIELEVI